MFEITQGDAIPPWTFVLKRGGYQIDLANFTALIEIRKVGGAVIVAKASSSGRCVLEPAFSLTVSLTRRVFEFVTDSQIISDIDVVLAATTMPAGFVTGERYRTRAATGRAFALRSYPYASDLPITTAGAGVTCKVPGMVQFSPADNELAAAGDYQVNIWLKDVNNLEQAFPANAPFLVRVRPLN